MQSLFLEEIIEAEEAPRLSASLEPQGRQMSVLRAYSVRVFATGLGLAAAACLAVALWPASASGLLGAQLAAVQEKAGKAELIKAFGQCGGQHWTNGTCCAHGCACVAESIYYSGCHTPHGLDDCDVEQVEMEAEAAVERVQDCKDDLDRRKIALKVATKAFQDAKKAAISAREDFMQASSAAKLKEDALKQAEHTEGARMHATIHEAKEELAKITRETKADLDSKTTEETAVRDAKLKDAKDAHDTAEAAAKKAQSEYDAINKAAADKGAKQKEVQDAVKKYEDEEKVRKEKDCGELFGTCTASNCCVLGCQPYWENKYFCQCEGPNKAQYCAWKDAVAKHKSDTEQLPTLTEDYDKLMQGNATKWAVLQTATSHYKEVAENAAADTKAAEEEFAENTKEPAAAAEEVLSAAKAKADKKIKEAKDLMESKTATARAAAKEADDTKAAKKHIAEAKHEAEIVAAKSASAAHTELKQAMTALASAKSAVNSWQRSGKGDTCGQDGDVDGMA